MDIEISKAKKKDFPYIREKIMKYVLDSSNMDWRQFFVARMKENVVAFGRIIDYGEFFEIASLGVDWYHRKKGIGKKMVFFLVQEVKTRDSRKPIYSVTHVDRFVASCGFIEVKDNYPDYLEYKRKRICRFDESRIKIMEWLG